MQVRMGLPVVALTVALMAGCQGSGGARSGHADMQGHEAHGDHGMGMMHASTAAGNWTSIHDAVAVIYPTKGNTVSGTIHFSVVDPAAEGTQEGVHIYGTITGLEPNSVHAFHVHEFGDASSADGTGAGGHYNPEGHHHGGPEAAEHHAGDLGNVKADGTGTVHVDMTVQDLSVAGAKNPVLGRSLVLHGKADDLASQPAGNAGPRIGVGVIGVAKSQ